ncbi:PREDICTED: uncharacterized protein LOC109244052 [Nicotiana attenuata]|uniref:uncharacterized protein LOC109244052 n=1 Tax=Nicotiana attenuata TaxID=49451 RepID=UPI0009045FD4|nr:PREDICTED: uncharacterized protein LOC109244052 [Nicotiana attenuata]
MSINEDIADAQLRELWDEYKTLDPTPTYGCPESKRHTERYQLQKLYQFLTGLKESYENAKNQVLMTRPLPNINQAYAMIINVESQRMHGKGAAPLTDNNEVAAMMSNKPHNTNYNGGTTCIAHALMSHLIDQNWIVDIVASNHMVHSLDLLDEYEELIGNDRNKVHLPTGEQIAITHKGVASFFKDNPVQNILHIPDFKYNLLLVSKITKELQYLANGRPVSGQQELHKQISTSFPTVNITSDAFNKCGNLATEQSCSVPSLWHKILGHAPLKVLQKLNVVPSLKLEDHHCIVCPIAKQSRLHFSHSLTCSSGAFDIVHAYVWRPYKIPTYDGKRLPAVVLQGKSPFEQLFHGSPSLHHLKIFGSP